MTDNPIQLERCYSEKKFLMDSNKKRQNKYNVTKNIKKVTFVFMYKNNVFNDQRTLDEIKEEFHAKTNGIFIIK